MIHDLLSLEAYFSQFKGVLGIEDYCFGSTDDILNRKAKVIRYPCLWVELLEEDIDANGDSLFSIRLVLQKNGGNQPTAMDRQTLNDLRRIMRQVLAKMQTDSPNQLVYYTSKAKFQYKERFANDDELLVVVDLVVGGIQLCP